MLSTDVLPSGISSPSFRFGNVDGISQRYIDNGSLVKLGDYKSVNFDAEQLQKFNADAARLVSALNKFGAAGLGDKINLGVLKVDTDPTVKYFAPVFAHGVTKNWTVALGLPIVNYQNKISLSQQFSNIDYYRRQFSGLSAELDSALATDLGQATNDTLAAKGYKRIENHDETFVGDVQIVSRYRFMEDHKQAILYQAQLNLPTGPQYNPDDLAAINIFGRTNINNSLTYSYRATSRITLVPYISYIFNIPDQITERVPTNENDTLPDASAKEDIHRHIGNTASIGNSVFYDWNDALQFGLGYEYSNKDRDNYSGSGAGRYDLLGQHTAGSAHRVRGQVSYSTVSSYFRKQSVIPFVVSLEVSDIIAGVNVERQFAQELTLMMFF
ncbi:MAG: hypothetical protein J7501_03290 [Bdellovibrio sp.]|nr:hypothetical protein [Bdellovibrio sp.]